MQITVGSASHRGNEGRREGRKRRSELGTGRNEAKKANRVDELLSLNSSDEEEEGKESEG